MKVLRTLLTVAAFGALFSTTANARDSFSLGINIGGYGYAPPPVVQYYPGPTTYYATPTYYYAPPVVSYQYYGGGYNNGYQNNYRQRESYGEYGRGHGHMGHGDGGHGRGHGHH
jgi:hypothetical protein